MCSTCPAVKPFTQIISWCKCSSWFSRCCFVGSSFTLIGGWPLLLMMCHWRTSYPSLLTLLLWRVSSFITNSSYVQRQLLCVRKAKVLWSALTHASLFQSPHRSSLPLWVSYHRFTKQLDYYTWNMKLHFAVPLCVSLCLIVGADTRLRVSYQEEELELRLPFGSHSRGFLREVNKAWSGRSEKCQRLWRCVEKDISSSCYSLVALWCVWRSTSHLL